MNPTPLEPPPPIGPKVLVVDDSAVHRRLAGAVVEQVLGWPVAYAESGHQALEAMARECPAVVVTDLQMPDGDGLELVEALRQAYPLVPVVLMTAYGSEATAIQALQQGAASYVPKQSLRRVLPPTLEQVLAAAQMRQRQNQLLERLTFTEQRFALSNDRTVVPALVTYLQEQLLRFRICPESATMRIGIALEEALLNAILHGNLEVSSALKQDGDAAFFRLADERAQATPYRDRQVHVTAKVSRQEASYAIRDEGPGFDPATLPDPTDPANIEKCSGRGLLLMRTFMTEVRHNATGNEITLTKRAE